MSLYTTPNEKILNKLINTRDGIFKSQDTINLLKSYIGNKHSEYVEDYISFKILDYILSDNGFVEVDIVVSQTEYVYANVELYVEDKTYSLVFNTNFKYYDMLPEVWVTSLSHTFSGGRQCVTFNEFYKELGHKVEYIKVPDYLGTQEYCEV